VLLTNTAALYLFAYAGFIGKLVLEEEEDLRGALFKRDPGEA